MDVDCCSKFSMDFATARHRQRLVDVRYMPLILRAMLAEPSTTGVPQHCAGAELCPKPRNVEVLKTHDYVS